jgi:Glycosyltransferase family 87
MSHNQAHSVSPKQALIVAVVCGALWTAFGFRLVSEARTGDFLNLYTGASFALHGDWSDIYMESGQLAYERRFVPGRRELTPFVRPPAYAVIMAPLALLPFNVAFWFWIAAQTAVLLLCWAWLGGDSVRRQLCGPLS